MRRVHQSTVGEREASTVRMLLDVDRLAGDTDQAHTRGALCLGEASAEVLAVQVTGTNEPPVRARSWARTWRRKSSGSSSNALMRPAGTFSVWLVDGVP